MSDSLPTPRRIAVVTGSRAEFGLLRPVLHAIRAHPNLTLQVIAAGEHHPCYGNSWPEVAAEFADALLLNEIGNGNHSERLPSMSLRFGACVQAISKQLEKESPDIVVVLGDRIEAFAAASAAAISGIRVAHLHGGDRAEGIADESMRHAIAKLAHLHLPATQQSAMRIIAMGEDPQRVHIVGSPAIDDLHIFGPMSDADFAALGSPQIVVLFHPTGDDDDIERDRAAKLISIATQLGPSLVLHPNHDRGRDGIMRAIEESSCRTVQHLPRPKFIGLLRCVRLLVGNSSAGLIECAAVPVRVVNIGSRQSGREMPTNVIDVKHWDYQTMQDETRKAMSLPPLNPADVQHPYGDGTAGRRTAEILATFDPAVIRIKKRNTY